MLISEQKRLSLVERVYCFLIDNLAGKLHTIFSVIKYWPFIKIGRHCRIENGLKIRQFLWRENKLQIFLNGHNTICHHTDIQGSGIVIFGERSYCGAFCVIGANELVSIGADVMIAQAVTIRDTDHAAFRIDVSMSKQGIVTKPVVIEDDVWIGHGASILKGVRVGRGSIIGAGSVVTRDVPPYSIVGGVPARIIRARESTQ